MILFVLLVIALHPASAWVPPSAAALALQAKIDHTIAATSRLNVSVREGTYDFGSASLNISGARSLGLVAEGQASLVFALGAALIVRDSADVSIAGPFSIDYAQPTYSQATVEALGAGCFSTATPPVRCDVDVRVHAGFPAPHPSMRPDLCFYPACETKLVWFDPAAGRMRRPQVVSWLYNSTLLSAAPGAARYRLSTMQLWAHNVAVGDAVAVAGRRCGGGACTLQLRNSTRVRVRSLAIRASCNMAVWELGGGGGHRYENLTIAPPPLPGTGPGQPRFLASNFDGLHSEGTLVGPTLVSSAMRHVGDDFFNVQNAIDIVLGWDAGAGAAGAHALAPALPSLIVADDSFGSTWPAPRGTGLRLFLPSEAVWGAREVWSGSVCASTSLAAGSAREARWRARAANVSAAFAARYGWSFAGFMARSFALVALTLCGGAAEAARARAAAGYTAMAQVRSSVGAVLAGNTFEDGLSRAGPLNSPGALVAGNVFNGTMLGGLLVSAEATWLSGNLGIENVTVRDNVFVDCCSYRRAGYSHGQCNGSVPVFNPAGTRGLRLINNTFR
eukprot:g5996.t1